MMWEFRGRWRLAVNRVRAIRKFDSAREARCEAPAVDVVRGVIPLLMDPCVPRLVLLPGLDGTASLFEEFIRILPDSAETVCVPYPTDASLSYAELMPIVREAFPENAPFVIVAES